MSRVWLLEVSALNAVDAPVTLRFASGKYKNANYYEVRLVEPGLFSTVAQGLVTRNQEGSTGLGDAVLTNADRGLDYLVDYAVDGRAAVLKLVEDGGSPMTVLTGTVERLTFDDQRVAFILRNPLEALSLDHPHTTYAGNNALPAGLEGVATDIKGQPKPKVFGNIRNATPKQVNTSRLIYQTDSGTASTVTAVYDRGVALTNGGSYPDLATLQSTAPTAGQFRAFQGYFRLGATPAGEVTFDADSTQNLLGDVFAKIALEAGFTLNASDQTAANAAGQVGLYLDTQRGTDQLLTVLSESYGGYYSSEGSTTLRLKKLAAGSSPVLTINDYQVLNIARAAAGAGENGLPVYRVVVKADPVETVQSEVAAGAGAVQAARVANQFREAKYENSAVKTRHPLSPELVLETALRSLTDGQTLADYLGGLLDERRDSVFLTARLDEDAIAALAIGVSVTVVTPRLGYSAGRTMVVLGYTVDARLSRAELKLWG